ncbi:MAG: hypothetical protein ACI9UV_000738 [Algoriphagus sp.]|jgi:hypothetical protein
MGFTSPFFKIINLITEQIYEFKQKFMFSLWVFSYLILKLFTIFFIRADLRKILNQI